MIQISELNPELRTGLTRLTQFILGMDGVLHLAEVVSAYAEGAWFTAALTTLHSMFFLFAVYFIGHDQKHHDVCDVPNELKPARWKKLLFAILLLLAIIAFTPLGELV